MRKLLLALLVLAPLACARAEDDGGASADARKTIDEATLQAHIRLLASDDLEGRAAGFPGNERAVTYLVDQIKTYGLAPAGEKGEYTQEFSFKDRRAKNVCAWLEGSDPKLKEEFVGIGCHLDHVGKVGQAVGGQSPGGPAGDEIWNGADDNASGTSAVLAVARAFAKGKAKPRRSLLFFWWNAEEAGLLGSKHWVKNPTRPLDRIVYYLNLDMVGRNPERPMDMEGVKNADGEILEKIISEACEAEGLKISKFDHSNEAMFRSDGASFLEQGIPASMMFTSWHADYHRTGDHWDKIAYPNLARIARSAHRIVTETANLETALKLNVDTPLRGKMLKIRGQDVAGRGAVKVTEVLDGPLSDAGLKVGDLIVSFRAEALPAARPLATLWMRVQQQRFDEAAELGIERSGASQTLKAVWVRK
jgi:hypothetical protein